MFHNIDTSIAKSACLNSFGDGKSMPSAILRFSTIVFDSSLFCFSFCISVISNSTTKQIQDQLRTYCDNRSRNGATNTSGPTTVHSCGYAFGRFHYVEIKIKNILIAAKSKVDLHTSMTNDNVRCRPSAMRRASVARGALPTGSSTRQFRSTTSNARHTFKNIAKRASHCFTTSLSDDFSAPFHFGSNGSGISTSTRGAVSGYVDGN